MIFLCLIGYLIILGIIIMDNERVSVELYRKLIDRLHSKEIDVAVHYLADGTYKIVASKLVNNITVKHIELSGGSLVQILEEILLLVEAELEQWFPPIVY
jgi:hypothetical protein